MLELLVILIVVGVIAVVVMRIVSAGRSPKTPDEQATTVRPDPSPAGADGPATRPDGEPIPGSQEDRRRHGKP